MSYLTVHSIVEEAVDSLEPRLITQLLEARRIRIDSTSTGTGKGTLTSIMTVRRELEEGVFSFKSTLTSHRLKYVEPK